MNQEEYSAACAKNNAEYKKEQLRLQQALYARKDQLHDLTKNYLEEKAKIEKAIRWKWSKQPPARPTPRPGLIRSTWPP